MVPAAVPKPAAERCRAAAVFKQHAVNTGTQQRQGMGFAFYCNRLHRGKQRYFHFNLVIFAHRNRRKAWIAEGRGECIAFHVRAQRAFCFETADATAQCIRQMVSVTKVAPGSFSHSVSSKGGDSSPSCAAIAPRAMASSVCPRSLLMSRILGERKGRITHHAVCDHRRYRRNCAGRANAESDDDGAPRAAGHSPASRHKPVRGCRVHAAG